MSQAFAAYWEGIRDRLEGELEALAPEFFGPDSEQPGAAVRRSLAAGKRLRGCLVCLVCEALGGSADAAIDAAAAIECVQAASLIHDDYVDGDRDRRDRPAEWTLHGSRQAVLLGDVMFATVIHRMVQRNPAAGATVARVIATMARGAYEEYLDQAALARGPHDLRYDPARYEYIIGLKTGALFGAAAALGAIAADAGAPCVARAFRFGARLGEAYQIADDLVDVAALLGDRPRPLTGLVAIVPALLYFAPSDPASVLRALRGAPDTRTRWGEHAVPLIGARMRAEVSSRVRRALSVLAQFPPGPARDLLRAMTGQTVAAMTAVIPSSR